MAVFRSPANSPELWVDEVAARVLARVDTRALDTIETKMLRNAEPDEQRTGSKPLLTLLDDEGRKYVLKVAEPALMAAEETAYALRRLGGRPAIPARIVIVEVEGTGPVEGLIKPYLEFDVKSELEPDTTRWTPLQREVMLLEHAWEWFLDNLDTNTSQYALVEPDGFPLNIDWDRAFASNGESPLSRFAKYKPQLPNARTFLYSDYVEGRVDLPFSVLMREARLIARLPHEPVRRIVERFARTRYDDPAMARELIERIMERQRTIESEVHRFVKSLLRERLEISVRTPQSLRARARNARVVLWNHWQVSLNTALRGPVGSLCRSILKRVRSRNGLARV